MSFLTYVNLVLKSFVKCRNCCLVVRFFQIEALHLHSGPRSAGDMKEGVYNM